MSRTALLLALLLVSTGCGGSHEDDPGFENLTFAEIPLDEGSLDGEVQLTRNILFIFDGSGSMSERPGRRCRGDRSFETKIDGARWAVARFLDKVPEDINIGLFVFDDRGVELRLPLDRENRRGFLAEVDEIIAGGGTPLAESIRFATDRLIDQYKEQLGYGEYRIVVVTDGLADGIPHAARYAASYGIPIYAIGLCVEDDHPLRRYAVSYRAADSFEDLEAGLEETLAELPSFDPVTFVEGDG